MPMFPTVITGYLVAGYFIYGLMVGFGVGLGWFAANRIVNGV